MKRIITSTLVVVLLFNIRLFSQSCNNNADFELGNKSGWQCKSGGYGPLSIYPATPIFFGTVLPNLNCIPLNGTLNAPPNGQNRHTLMSAAGGNDVNSGFNVGTPLVPRIAPRAMFPNGINNYSFRLGNDATGNFNYQGKTLSQAEAIKFSFQVTPSNAGFTYLYAVFLQDPNHSQESQPRFEIRVLDSRDSLIPCGYYKVVAGDTTAKKFYTGDNGYVYTNWTNVGLDLTGYIGQTVSIEFITSDCIPAGSGTSTTCINNVCTTRSCNSTSCTTCSNGNCTVNYPYSPGSHSAYAYIDMYCAPLSIIQSVLCVGSSSIQLCAPPGYLGYTWPGGQPGLTGNLNSPCVTVNNPVAGTTYSVNLTSVTGCPTNTTVTLKGFGIAVNSIHPTCFGANNGGATVTPSGTTNPTYSWAPSGGTSATATGLSAGTYTVTVMEGNCIAVQQVTLTEPPAQSGNAIAYHCEGDSLAWLYATKGHTSYQWFDAGMNPIAGATDDSLIVLNPVIGTLYYVQYTDPVTGCAVVTSVTITNNPDVNKLGLNPALWASNVFTPNGDGKNDYFELNFPKLLEVHMQVYDRWGLKVFETDKIGKGTGWDGKFENKEAPEGVYYWIIDYSFRCTTDESVQANYGFVHLIRSRK